MELKETEKRWLEAVIKRIEEEGFTQIGINRIAKKAQCDKAVAYTHLDVYKRQEHSFNALSASNTKVFFP